MNGEEQQSFFRAINIYVRQEIEKAAGPLQDEIAKLKAQVEELEKRGISYKGIYQRSCEYRRGDMTTHDHNLWCCIEDAEVNQSPGASPSKWQLALRAGRDGDRARLPTKSGSSGLR